MVTIRLGTRHDVPQAQACKQNREVASQKAFKLCKDRACPKVTQGARTKTAMDSDAEVDFDAKVVLIRMSNWISLLN